MTSIASCSVSPLGSASLARSWRYFSRLAMDSSEPTKTTTVSRPSSVFPVVITFTRGDAAASAR